MHGTSEEQIAWTLIDGTPSQRVPALTRRDVRRFVRRARRYGLGTETIAGALAMTVEELAVFEADALDANAADDGVSTE